MNTTPPEPDQGGSVPDGPPADQIPVRWPGLIAVLARIRRVIDRVLALLCIITFTLLVIVVSWQVFTREVLNNSAPWTEEAARYTFVVLAVLAAAYVFSERGHIAVEILVKKLPLAGQRVMAVVIELIVIFFFVMVFIIGGWRVADNAWNQDLSTLPVTVGQVYLVLPIAGVIIVFYSIAHLIGVLAGAEKPTPEFDENAEAI
ncbi:TRAP transporter small permease [Microbacterium sp. H1-D42]|uniref:TRAP transporter small permease n=1 Tax=Microbacterium sp. H1-D42 TaxID=2925844 RepID=UPI001F531C71|nr:TRAP transporter small permease [Microbacterium sp. H1-D42]UNK70716.1 TRAP transporter small permease [Microbacterium sp. H1-D42]